MRRIALYSLGVVSLAMFVSCASAPPEQPQPETTQPETTQPQAAAIPAPDAERTQANNLRQTIDQYSLSDYDAADYASGVQSLDDGEKAYGGDNASAKQSFEAAISSFDAVLAAGWPQRISSVQSQTESSKKTADDLKASVAVADEYSKANAVYQRALQEKAAGDMEKASTDFEQAGPMFDAVAATAKQKRDAALQSLQAARQDMGTSEQKAADADKTLQDEGITPTGSPE